MNDIPNSSASPSDGNSPVVCTNCLTPNAKLQHLCRACGTPLTSYAEIDPLGQIYAQGDTYRKAIAHPQKPIVLVGMWLIFGPKILSSLLMLPWNLHNTAAPFGHTALRPVFLVLNIAICSVIAIVSCVILCRVTRNFLKIRHAA